MNLYVANFGWHPSPGDLTPTPLQLYWLSTTIDKHIVEAITARAACIGKLRHQITLTSSAQGLPLSLPSFPRQIMYISNLLLLCSTAVVGGTHTAFPGEVRAEANQGMLTFYQQFLTSGPYVEKIRHDLIPDPEFVNLVSRLGPVPAAVREALCPPPAVVEDAADDFVVVGEKPPAAGSGWFSPTDIKKGLLFSYFTKAEADAVPITTPVPAVCAVVTASEPLTFEPNSIVVRAIPRLDVIVAELADAHLADRVHTLFELFNVPLRTLAKAVHYGAPAELSESERVWIAALSQIQVRAALLFASRPILTGDLTQFVLIANHVLTRLSAVAAAAADGLEAVDLEVVPLESPLPARGCSLLACWRRRAAPATTAAPAHMRSREGDLFMKNVDMDIKAVGAELNKADLAADPVQFAAAVIRAGVHVLDAYSGIVSVALTGDSVYLTTTRDTVPAIPRLLSLSRMFATHLTMTKWAAAKIVVINAMFDLSQELRFYKE